MYEVEYIVGVPSGEVINIKSTMVNFLKQRGLIYYDIRYKMYLYNDKEYESLRKIIFTFQANQTINKDKDRPSTRFSLRVLDFMGTQKHIKSYSIGSDSSVSVKGNIIVVGDSKFDAFPFTFSKVEGDVIIRNCRLQNLRGCPKIITGNFIVSSNELYDLIDGPEYVGSDYECDDNVLTTLSGSPEVIRGDMDCSNNLLQNLKGSPLKVWGVFDCSKNKHLTTLVDAPASGMIISDIKNKFGGGNN